MYSNSKKVEGLEISDEILETLDYKNTTILQYADLIQLA